MAYWRCVGLYGRCVGLYGRCVGLYVNAEVGREIPSLSKSRRNNRVYGNDLALWR